jgi:Transposase DDE domain
MWLDKRGNSSQEERKLLILRYIHLFSLDSIDCIIADREFIGREWFGFLINNPIKFYLRIRENLFVSHKGRELKVLWLFNNLPLNTTRQIEKPVLIGQHWVYLSDMKIINKKGNIAFVIVATYQYELQTMQVYAKRWTIECFFKAIKTAGFNIEDTQLKDQKRLEKL